jgi:hypothetical protein
VNFFVLSQRGSKDHVQCTIKWADILWWQISDTLDNYWVFDFWGEYTTTQGFHKFAKCRVFAFSILRRRYDETTNIGRRFEDFTEVDLSSLCLLKNRYFAQNISSLRVGVLKKTKGRHYKWAYYRVSVSSRSTFEWRRHEMADIIHHRHFTSR